MILQAIQRLNIAKKGGGLRGILHQSAVLKFCKTLLALDHLERVFDLSPDAGFGLLDASIARIRPEGGFLSMQQIFGLEDVVGVSGCTMRVLTKPEVAFPAIWAFMPKFHWLPFLT